MKIALLTTDNREPFREYSKPAPWFGTAPEALLQGFAQLPELEVHVVSCARERMSSPEKLAPNVFFHHLPVGNLAWMKTAYWGCIRATKKKLREIQPDIVHGQGTERDCAISAVFSGFPNVLTIHGNMRLIARVTKARPLSFGWLAARLEQRTIPRSHGVVCITQYTRAAVADLAKRTWVVPNAVDSSFFEVESQPPPALPRILCVGRISPRKNQNAFIRALEPLAEKRKFEALFLGEAVPGHAYDDEFFRLIRTRPWCRHGGFADREKLKSHFQSASLLALPSLEDNCPMAVLEAMAAGLPAIAARVGGVPELIEEGQTGWLCDPLDAAAMRSAVERGLADPAAAREMAKRAKTRARAKFHPKVIAQRHLEIYREVLALGPERDISISKPAGA